MGGPQLKPEDFTKGTLINRAYSLLQAAMMRSAGGLELDRKSAVWLIPEKHRWDLFSEMGDHHMYLSHHTNPAGGVSLFGMSVRFTLGDPDSTPEIMLVLEPVLVDRRRY